MIGEILDFILNFIYFIKVNLFHMSYSQNSDFLQLKAMTNY